MHSLAHVPEAEKHKKNSAVTAQRAAHCVRDLQEHSVGNSEGS